MRINKFGIRGLKCVSVKRQPTYFWTSPVSLQKQRIFRHKTLGIDFEAVVIRAAALNAELEAYRVGRDRIKSSLINIDPGTIGLPHQAI